MLQDIITYINTLDPFIIYLVLFFFAYIENIFPPSPSDVVLLIGATIIANTPLGFLPIIVMTSIASGLGFITMYFIGEFFGEKILRKGKLKFLREEALQKADYWFNKYGYKLILINRFIPGTRAVISFFSGVHRLKPAQTFFYAGISSLIWNSLLIWLGMILGKNIPLFDYYLKTYSNIILGITIITIAYFSFKFWRRKKKQS